MQKRTFFLATAISLAVILASTTLPAQNPLGPPDSATPAGTTAISPSAASHVPLSFEPNQGQSDAVVRFLSHGDGYNLYLTAQEAVVVMKRPTSRPAEPFGAKTVPPSEPRVPSVVRMELAGANPTVQATGLDRQEGYSNYILGNDPSRWHSHVTHFGRVQYSGLYPGVDLVYYGQGRQLEYDFVLAPGADAQNIALAIRGGSLHLAADGGLVVNTPDGDLQLHPPVAYQTDSAGKRDHVEAKFDLAGERVTFALGDYDRRRQLVIDPVVSFSTYLGGSAEDRSSGTIVNKSGVYVAGSTESADFPTKNSLFPFVGGCATCHDLFVTKLNTTGTALVFSTYIGGTGDDFSLSITLDGTDNAYLAGETSSTDFPTTAGAFQRIFGGSGSGTTGLIGDAFVLKLNSTGSALLYSTYMGGSSDEVAERVVVDKTNNAYIGGMTASSNFPTSAGAFRTTCPVKSFYVSCYAAWVAKLNSSGTALTYSTYLNDTDTTSYADTALGLAVDVAGHAFVGGEMGPGFPTTAGAFQPVCGGTSTCAGVQGYVAELNTTGTGLMYGTYLGSKNNGGVSEVSGVALDATGAAYATGIFVANPTADFPTTAGVVQPTYGGGSGCLNFGCGDAFVSKLNATGTALVYSTYLGGSGDESALNIALDSQKNAYIESQTTSTNFPLKNATQATFGGGAHDGAITELNATGATLVYSSYLGGNGEDIPRGMALDPSGNIYLVGRTASTNFPVTTGAFQTKCGTDGLCNGGLFDAFAVKISPSVDMGVTNSAPATVTSGGTLTYTITATNHGPDNALTAQITDTLPAGTTFKSVTTVASVTCTKPAVGGTGKVVCTIPSLGNGKSSVETLVVNVTATSGSTIHDTASVSTGASDAVASNNSATASTTVN